ncbi:hypothetical protein GCM10010420_45570 [Streptomyces glaucosporus]|uniref:Knr4/Smi1-like domain-containing protein n=1 Tax=Streptomyces glaucosporus TaxID=284044 RepID=A0ABN3IQR5_9ACTN
MSDTIDRLTRIVPPPGSPTGKDGSSHRQDLGFSLPEDYERLVEIYGGSRWDDYLYILEPGCPNSHYDMVTWEREQSEILEEDWQFEEKPAQLRPKGSRLVPWATTDNGEVLFWLLLPGQAPEDWTVMIREARGEGWEHFRMGCVDFLVAALTGEVRSEILSSRFPLAEHRVEPLSIPHAPARNLSHRTRP